MCHLSNENLLFDTSADVALELESLSLLSHTHLEARVRVPRARLSRSCIREIRRYAVDKVFAGRGFATRTRLHGEPIEGASYVRCVCDAKCYERWVNLWLEIDNLAVNPRNCTKSL